MKKIKSAYEQFLEKPEHQRLFEQERLLVEATELLTEILEKEKVTRAQLAQRLGKSKAFITQVLRGNHNMTLRTLADLFGAVDRRIALSAEPRSKGLLVVTHTRGRQTESRGPQTRAKDVAAGVARQPELITVGSHRFRSDEQHQVIGRHGAERYRTRPGDPLHRTGKN
jgi:transcriptional regulator with XRE-family HTH domain